MSALSTCTAKVINPTEERIIIDYVEIMNISFPFNSEWSIEYPSRIDSGMNGEIVFRTTVSAGEFKVLLLWEQDVLIDLVYQISGLPANANDEIVKEYHATYTRIHVSVDKKDVIADSFVNVIGYASQYYEVKGAWAIIVEGSRKAEDVIKILNGAINFGKWTLGKLHGG